MYIPSGSFENARYSEIYGYDPNATRGDLRRQGRQFRRYLKTAAADYDRALFEASEQARVDDSMKAQSDAFARDLADSMRAPIETKPMMMTEEEILAQEAKMKARQDELRMKDLEARIANMSRFDDAFALARKSGFKTFKWRGRLYNTKLASEVNSGAGRTPARPTTPALTPPTGPTPVSPETPALPATPAPPAGGGWREVTPAPAPTSQFDLNAFAGENNLPMTTIDGKTYARYDPQGMGDYYVGADGTIYYAGLFGHLGIPVDERPPKQRTQDALQHNILSDKINNYTPSEQFLAQQEKQKKYEQWEANYIKTHPRPATNASLAGSSAIIKWNQDFDAAKRAAGFKQGGSMPRVKYFQQGGAVQQDVMSQIQALVQAAVQGDEKATQQITQIMEAAKSGDQQAVQLAQMIQQVIQQMQGQATAAKWGAKLGYIKSLKYAKGGKTCPSCEKKVEMKACGGKKAKKHYFGGLI